MISPTRAIKAVRSWASSSGGGSSPAGHKSSPSTKGAVRIVKTKSVPFIPLKATVKGGVGITKVGQPLKVTVPERFNYYQAGNSAVDYYGAGEVVGSVFGCAIGAAATIELGGVGCVAGMTAGIRMGGPLGGVVGFFIGGYNSRHADDFEWLPDDITSGLKY